MPEPLIMMRQRLRYLYGHSDGDRAFFDLEGLLRRFGALARLAAAGRFDQSDMFLITYGDTFIASRRAPLAALHSFATRHLAGRVSGIHILPFFPYSSDYGFSVVDYLRVNPEIGTWDDILSIHSDFQLMFDFVLNHVSVQSAWFRAFLRGEAPYDEFFITADPHTDLSRVTRPRNSPLLTPFETTRGKQWVWTTFSDDQVDLNYRNPKVLLAMVEVMLRYVEQGADLLRMDAVGFLWKEPGTACINLPQAHEVVKLLRDVLDAVAPDVAIVTETNVPHRDNISYFGNGNDEAQMVYQFPLPILVLDAFVRGNSNHLSKWAAELAVPSDRTVFFNFLASHDGIGVVPANGILSGEEIANLVRRVCERGGEVSYKTNPDGSESVYEFNITFFDALSSPHDSEERWDTKLDRFLCSQAILLGLSGVPGIYAHSLLGSHNDYAAYEKSKWKRDLNHEQLNLPELERKLADPESDAARVFAGYTHLLTVRRQQSAFHPSSPQKVFFVGPTIFAFQRGPFGGQTIVALHNISAAAQVVDPRSLQLGRGRYRDLLGGQRYRSDEAIRLSPYEVMWLEYSATDVVGEEMFELSKGLENNPTLS